jgi:outer membrane biosynthesis protein TonB
MDILEKMQKEWELTLLLFVFLILLIAGGIFAMKMLEEEEGGSNGPSALPASPHFFDMNSLAYLEPAKLPEVVNPLAFRHSLEIPKPKPPAPPPPKEQPKEQPKDQPKPQQQGPAKPTQQVTTPTKTAAQPTAAPTKPTPPPPKPKPKRKIRLTYSGYSSVEGGLEKAWVKAEEVKAKKQASGRFEKGAKLLDAVQIVAFDADKMVVQHSGGKKVTINKGKKNQREVTVE